MTAAGKQYSPSRGVLKGIELAAVIADRECGALENARGRDLPALLVPYGPEDRSSLKRVLHEHCPDLILSTFHKVLDPDVVQDFKGKIINLHYSLLPLFKRTIGTAPVEQALAAGCRFLGTTVHFVTEDVDGGPIVSQSVIPVAEGETVTAVMDRVFRSGCLNLLNAVRIATEPGPEGVRGPGCQTGRSVFSPPPSSMGRSSFLTGSGRNSREARRYRSVELPPLEGLL